MKIFLIGFMGSGKTTLGKRLASKLGYSFIDLDHAFEQHAGFSIPEYFHQYGEGKFRELESEVLKNTPYPDDVVVATGGGLPCFFNNIDWINAQGTSVYLSLSPKALALRLENAVDERPVLRGLKGKDLEDFISERLLDREPFYKKAKIEIKGADLTPERVMEVLKSNNF